MGFLNKFYGDMGSYLPTEGYKIDFYPYDMTRALYREYMIDSMMQYDYIQEGETKAVDVDFTMMWPGSGETYIYVNVNLLIEFSVDGQVIPTRFDLRPIKLSPFSPQNPDHSLLVLEVFRIILVLQVVVSLMMELRKMPIL